jgi:CO/xanthine dehydrogenase Mo-binding subunit
VKLKKPERYRYIGKSARRLDISPKVDGTAVFGCDVRLPGMLRAALAWSPVYGAKPVAWDEAAALAVPGVHMATMAMRETSGRCRGYIGSKSAAGNAC